MNFPIPETAYGRQRCRQWTPLFTQQLRLRHLEQVMLYNVEPSSNRKFYFTLHLSAMCSPFYTSDMVEQSFHKKWTNFDFKNTTYSPVSVFVIRIWEKRSGELDTMLLSWGVNLSGLVYLGNKILDVQPEYFKENSVIFYLQGGFFTSQITIRNDLQKPLPFIDNLNLVSNESNSFVYRHIVEKYKKSEVKDGYDVKKLQKIHSLQINLRNKTADVQLISQKISAKCGMCESTDGSLESTEAKEQVSLNRHATPLLTMYTLNKMLYPQEKPTRAQIQKTINIKKDIEVKKLRTKLLLQEKNKKYEKLRHLKQKFLNLVDENEERESETMNNYRQLNRDSEKLKEWKREELHMKENLHHVALQLHHRQRQLMEQLLDIYPIFSVPDQKYWIHDVNLPNSDELSDCSDNSLPVALGYIAHVLLMCSSFLQVPLRYPITYFGSRSHITDHITSNLIDKDKDFPLYTKGKDKMQFTYAVYLLNKNIAQLRWLCGLYTHNLRGTLSNLLSLLQKKDSKPSFRPSFVNHQGSIPSPNAPTFDAVVNFNQSAIETNVIKQNTQSADSNKTDTLPTGAGNLYPSEFPYKKPFGSQSNKSDPVIDTLRHEYHLERSRSPTRRVTTKRSDKSSNQEKLGLNQILLVPEAYMKKQISSTDFKTYLNKEIMSDHNSCSSVDGAIKTKETTKPEDIEQGTDIINSCDSPHKPVVAESNQVPIRISSDTCISSKLIKQNRRKSRSVGSFTEEETGLGTLNSFEIGSDPLINISSEKEDVDLSGGLGIEFKVENTQQEFLEQWLNTSSALVSSDENFFPDEALESTIVSASPKSNNITLNERTDALLSKTSFNLIKPK